MVYNYMCILCTGEGELWEAPTPSSGSCSTTKACLTGLRVRELPGTSVVRTQILLPPHGGDDSVQWWHGMLTKPRLLLEFCALAVAFRKDSRGRELNRAPKQKHLENIDCFQDTTPLAFWHFLSSPPSLLVRWLCLEAALWEGSWRRSRPAGKGPGRWSGGVNGPCWASDFLNLEKVAVKKI